MAMVDVDDGISWPKSVDLGVGGHLVLSLHSPTEPARWTLATAVVIITALVLLLLLLL